MDPTCRSCSDYPCTCGRAIGVPIDNGPGQPMTIRTFSSNMELQNYDEYLAEQEKSHQIALKRREEELARQKNEREEREDLWLRGQLIDAETAQTWLWRSITRGDVDLCRRCLAGGADPTLGGGIHQPQFNPLHSASSKGNAAIVELFLTPEYMMRHADKKVPFIDSNSGTANTQFTPLLFAIKGGHVETVKVLLDNGADPRMDDGFGEFNMRRWRD